MAPKAIISEKRVMPREAVLVLDMVMAQAGMVMMTEVVKIPVAMMLVMAEAVIVVVEANIVVMVA